MKSNVVDSGPPNLQQRWLLPSPYQKVFFGNDILCIYWPVALNTNFQWAGWCADVTCIQLSYITTLFPLGKCDPGCNNAACEWDGLDCDQQELPDLAKGELILVIDMTPEVFLNQSESFLRTTSRLLKAKVEFKLAPDGLPMVCYNTLLSRVHDATIKICVG